LQEQWEISRRYAMFATPIADLIDEAGIDTVVLERGRRWPIRRDRNTFTTFENPDGRAFWLRNRTLSAAPSWARLANSMAR
jgi:hypothetical protein